MTEGLASITVLVYTRSLLGLSILAFTTLESWAFTTTTKHLPVLRKAASTTITTTTLRSVGDFDDLPSIGEAASPDGEALAKAFYQQLRAREENDDDDNNDEQQKPVMPKGMLTEGEARYVNRQAFSRRQEIIASSEISPTTARKFTGQPNADETPSAGLFSGRGASVYSIPAKSPRQRMVENEFSLVGRNERSLLIQIAATLALLTFAIYIGMTGGISSNDWSSVPNSIDTSMDGMEGVLPVPTDTETSVWL